MKVLIRRIANALHAVERVECGAVLKGHSFSCAGKAHYSCSRERTSVRKEPALSLSKGSAFQTLSAAAFFVTVALAMLLAACSIKVDDKNKEAKKADIQTPLANLKVDTSAASADNGIPVYPGATPRPESNGDKHHANVNIAAMGFGVKVIAAEYVTPDSPDKVKTFYLDNLKRWGSVLECRGTGGDHGANGDWNNGEGDKPVTCGDTKGDGWEIKVGTRNNQRVVAIHPDGSGTRFGTALVQIHGKEGTL